MSNQPLGLHYNLEKRINLGMQLITYFHDCTPALMEHYLASIVASMAMNHNYSTTSIFKIVTHITLMWHTEIAKLASLDTILMTHNVWNS